MTIRASKLPTDSVSPEKTDQKYPSELFAPRRRAAPLIGVLLLALSVVGCASRSPTLDFYSATAIEGRQAAATELNQYNETVLESPFSTAGRRTVDVCGGVGGSDRITLLPPDYPTIVCDYGTAWLITITGVTDKTTAATVADTLRAPFGVSHDQSFVTEPGLDRIDNGDPIVIGNSETSAFTHLTLGSINSLINSDGLHALPKGVAGTIISEKGVLDQSNALAAKDAGIEYYVLLEINRHHFTTQHETESG